MKVSVKTQSIPETIRLERLQPPTGKIRREVKNMTSRERLIAALNHREPDKVPVDFGGTTVTGIHAQALDRLHKFLGIEDRTVRVYEPMQMLGIIEEDIALSLGSDVIGLYAPGTLLGYTNDKWKPWQLPGGTNVLIGEGFQVTYNDDGSLYAYPKGNLNAPPSAKMPAEGIYFDNLIRQEDLGSHTFNARTDYADQYTVFSEEECRYYEQTSKALYENSECAVFGNFFLGGVGDIFHIPAAWLEYPKGIRDIEEWIIAHYQHPDYVKELFDMQTEIQLKNLELYHQAVGNRIVAIAISGTDFGGQNSLLISKDMYREFYKPYHKTFNDWVHEHTEWKTFSHTCGSITPLMDEFIEAGFDILNPVQFSAADMDLDTLKQRFGSRVVFWGGGVNPQATLPFGTPEEVREETRNNVEILAKGGGFICGTVHNIQAPTPPESIVAFFESINV